MLTFHVEIWDHDYPIDLGVIEIENYSDLKCEIENKIIAQFGSEEEFVNHYNIYAQSEFSTIKEIVNYAGEITRCNELDM